MKKFSAAILLAATSLFPAFLPATAGENAACVVRTFPLNPYRAKLDGQWQGSIVASDGKVYFGSSTHAHDAAGMLFQYDPESDRIRPVIPDLSAACHEDASTQVPQGKLHSDIVEFDGWLYMSTHLANYWNAAAEAYTGSHLLGYELGSLERGEAVVRDFAVTKPRFSCYSAIAVDPVRRCLYSIATPFAPEDIARHGAHIIRTRIDAPDGPAGREDLGQPAAENGRGTCYAFFLDARGDLWFPMAGGDDWKGSGHDRLFVLRAGASRFESFDHALPEMTTWEANRPSKFQDESWWVWGAAAPDRSRFFFTMKDGRNDDGGSIYVFDPSRMPDTRKAFREVAFIGGSTLALSLAGDRIYFVRRSDGRPAEIVGRDEIARGVALHLYRVLLDPADGEERIRDYGRIVDRDGRVPMRIPVIAADGAGRVYLTGDWYLKDDDPESMHTLRHRGGSRYVRLDRGQMFAVADVGE